MTPSYRMTITEAILIFQLSLVVHVYKSKVYFLYFYGEDKTRVTSAFTAEKQENDQNLLFKKHVKTKGNCSLT